MNEPKKSIGLAQMVEPLVDEILKASGSALKNYSMHKTREEMFSVAKVALFKAYILGKEGK